MANNKQKQETIEKRRGTHKGSMLEYLAKMPIIQIACQQAGISRATYYRWLKTSPTFKRNVSEAIKTGEALINDMSESQLIALIKEKNFPAVRYWLDRRHPRFKRPPEPEEHEDDKVTYKIVKY